MALSSHVLVLGRSVLLLVVAVAAAASAQAADYVLRTAPATPGVRVFVDGQLAGMTDEAGRLLATGVEPGAHTVRLETDAGVVASAEVHFDPDLNTVDVQVPASPAPAAATAPPAEPAQTRPLDEGGPPIDYLIDTNVPGAGVFVDGRQVATTSIPEARVALRLAVGRTYTLRIAKEGFRDAMQTFVADEVGNRLSLRLEPMPASIPAGASPGRQARSSVTGIVVGSAVLLVMGAAAALVVVLRRQAAPEAGAGPASGRTTTPVSFDRYRVAGTLGQGGVATIYRAVDATDGQAVALKILDAKWMGDPDMVQKFLSEAEAIRAIVKADATASVVRVFRSGREGDRLDGRPFIALELLQGETLEKRLETRTALGVREAAGIGFQMARTLHAVHRAGIVHRDLTPDNVFLVPGDVKIGDRVFQGAPKVVLIDFGVARQEFLSRVTMDGSIAGKPLYMSPEQCRGEKVDGRSDLYALGIILHALVTGSEPFTGKNPFDVMNAQQHTSPPPLDGRASPAYAALVADLLKKRREERPQSAAAVAARLETIFLQGA